MNRSISTYCQTLLDATFSGTFVGSSFTSKAQRERLAEYPFYHSPSSDEGNACGFSDSKAQRERFAEYYDFSTANTTIRDEETGFGYFGARYYDSELLIGWMSVDRYASKYPSISPYAYCAWNPIRLTDSTGDTIDVSRLSSTALERYNASMQELQKSPLFSSYYDDLQNSTNTYYIEEGAGKGGSGSFEPSRSTVSAKLDDLYTLSQELFHAFQTDCNIYTSNDASVREAEGDLTSQIVMYDLGKISIIEDWSLQLYNYIDDYTGILTPQFSRDFSNMVDLRINFYKQRELQDDVQAPKTYIQDNSGKPPLALQKAIRKSIQLQHH